MAIGDSYVTASDLAAYLGIDDADDDALLTPAAAAASQRVEQFCQRQFNKVTSATARVFESRDGRTVDVDDFHTTTGLVIASDTADNGTYGTTWTTADYVLIPHNGIDNGVPGFPYRQIRAVESLSWPCRTGRPRVQVTAQWGWAAVPASVTLATKIIGALLYNLKDSPLGVASFADAGLIRVRDVPQAAMLLERYQHPANTGPLVA